MRVTIRPSRAMGNISAPPSKSVAHRLLICSALAGGGSVSGLDYSGDILATLDCLTALGFTYEKSGDRVSFTGGKLRPGTPCARESGSTLRFLAPLAALCVGQTTFTGSERLFLRPLGEYERVFRERGLVFEKKSDSLTVSGLLSAGEYTLRGDISSQFVSGLLFVLPLLEGESTVRVIPPFESRSYVDMTVYCLGLFGINIIKKDENTFFVPGGGKYIPADTCVPGDFTNAAYLDAFSYIGGDVRISPVDGEIPQGDRIYKTLFEKLKNGPAQIDLSDTPDLAPVLFALAAALHGGTFTGCGRLRYKESNRIEAMCTELAKFGVELQSDGERVTVGCTLKAPGIPLCSHNDHRIVMALAPLCAITGGQIEGAEAVGKSFPGYFEIVSQLGVDIKWE